MKIIVALLAAALPAASADFTLPEPKELIATARASAAQSALEAFLDNLGDAVYEGSGGTLTRDGESYDITETRVIVQRKTLHGHPGATLRFSGRAALRTNPAHIESVNSELSLEVSGGSLIILRDGKADAATQLEKAPSADAVIVTYRDAYYRYHPEVVETLSLTLKDGSLSVDRTRFTGGVERERESFSALRR